MKLTVYTLKNCPRCPAAKELCSKIAKERNLNYEEIDIQDNIIEAFSRQIVSAPSIEINEDVVFRGQLPTKEELLNEIGKRQ